MIGGKILQFLYPNTCPFCEEVLPRGENICEACDEDLPYIPFSLCKKGVEQSLRGGHASEFRDIKKLVAPFYYEDPVKEGVHRFKFRGKPGYHKIFGIYMAQSAGRFLPEQVQLITAIPMTGRDRGKRGYNQAKLLGEEVGRLMEVPYGELLQKVERNDTQHMLSAKERAGNVLGIYEVADKARVKDKVILLCDDICTTGHTLNECAKMLKLAGARAVYGVVLAAAVRDQKEDI